MWNLSQLAQLSSLFGTVNLGDRSNDQDVPIWLAIRILPAAELQARLTGAVLHIAQAKSSLQDKGAVEVHNRLTAELVDEFCGTPPHPWPWPHALQQLGSLAERYPAGSVLRAAAFDLMQRIVSRAAELGKR
jgi:hypothetical protein